MPSEGSNVSEEAAARVSAPSGAREDAGAGAQLRAQLREYTLYCFAQSGNAYKCALALQLAGADWAPRFVDYFGGETRESAYRELNIMGEAPVLEHRGMRLSQSGVILDYLAESLGRFGAASSRVAGLIIAALGIAVATGLYSHVTSFLAQYSL